MKSMLFTIVLLLSMACGTQDAVIIGGYPTQFTCPSNRLDEFKIPWSPFSRINNQSISDVDEYAKWCYISDSTKGYEVICQHYDYDDGSVMVRDTMYLRKPKYLLENMFLTGKIKYFHENEPTFDGYIEWLKNKYK